MIPKQCLKHLNEHPSPQAIPAPSAIRFLGKANLFSFPFPLLLDGLNPLPPYSRVVDSNGDHAGGENVHQQRILLSSFELRCTHLAFLDCIVARLVGFGVFYRHGQPVKAF